MAPLKVPLPETLKFGQEGDTAGRWKLFEHRQTNYTVIAELEISTKKPIFLHYLGDDSLTAFNSFQLAEDATVEQIIVVLIDTLLVKLKQPMNVIASIKGNREMMKMLNNFFVDLQGLTQTYQFCDTCRD